MNIDDNQFIEYPLMGVYDINNNNEIISLPNRIEIDGERILASDWKNTFALLNYGIYTENFFKYNDYRVRKLHEIYSQSVMNKYFMNEIKLYGWDYRINNDLVNITINNGKWKAHFRNLNMEMIDLTGEDAVTHIDESKVEVNCYPLYVVLSWTHTPFGKIIRKATKGIYTHCSFSLDDKLDKLYTFNGNTNGFSLENINDTKNYPHDDEACISVYCIMVKKNKFQLLKDKLNEFLKNKDNYSYGFLTALGIALNKPIEFEHSLICSQFVDILLKSINLDFTHKKSSLVSPEDFYQSFKTNNTIYKVYEGKIKDYKPKAVSRIVNKLMKSDDTVVYEAKSFPVQFDKEGNLLIQNMGKINYQLEYDKSHKLLKIYSEDNNIEGMKYELSKLWFLNTELEKKIYHSNDSKEKKDEYYKIRSRILNDFNKYLKQVQSIDDNFNFTEYYNNTPFSDASVKIDKYTLQYVKEILAKLILRKK